MIKNRKNQKGFTLIELLVVIAIIAVLAVVVVLTLNPAELLRQARDSNRLSDFATLKSALSLYGTDVNTSTPLYGSTYNLYTASASATATIGTYTTTSTALSWGFLGGEAAITTNTARSITGSGWIPVNFSAISSGAPIGNLPVDPVNSGNNIYIYAASSTVFKLTTHMESLKYNQGGSGDVTTNDGGNDIYAYEQGSNLTGL